MNTNRRDWICLIGSSELGLIAAQRCGFDVGLCTDGGELSEQAAAIAVLTTPVRLRDFESVRKGVMRLMEANGLPRAIVSFREYGCAAAAIISTDLGLPTIPLDVVEAVRDKVQMRRCLLGDPRLSLPFHEGDRESIRHALAVEVGDTPWIVKPCDRSGSEHVSLIADRGQLDTWYAKATDCVPRWISEPFLDGPEVSVEGVTFGGEHHFLGVTAKETTGPDGFVEVGHCFPATLDLALRQAVLAVADAALTRLGVCRGASHTEIKIDPRRGPVLIETHTRPGGDYIPELVALATGLSQYELAIESLFSDVPPDALRKRAPPHAAAAVRFLTPPPGVVVGLTVDDAALTGVLRWRVEKWMLDRVAPLDSSGARAGYVIYGGGNAEAATAGARAATTAIRLLVRPSGVDRCAR